MKELFRVESVESIRIAKQVAPLLLPTIAKELSPPFTLPEINFPELSEEQLYFLYTGELLYYTDEPDNFHKYLVDGIQRIEDKWHIHRANFIWFDWFW